jgi:hypothetical protein
MKDKIFHSSWHTRGLLKCVSTLMALLILLGVSACIASYEFDVEGTWDYTKYTSEGNPYDKGTITFSGNPMNGSYVLVNYEQEELEGTFTVQDDEIRLTVAENWKGTFSDDNNMSGDWWQGDGARGTFEATRQ